MKIRKEREGGLTVFSTFVPRNKRKHDEMHHSIPSDDSCILILQSPSGEWKDSVRYDTHSSKETVGRYPDGGCNLMKFYHPTIKTQNMMTSYDSVICIDTNAIRPPSRPDEILSINYYTISGIRSLKPTNGIYIKEVLYRNGQKQQSKKVIFGKMK